jgi:superfamily II DNA or RNA helicase/ferredoxin-thioredoxin reductase catalytic subunit
MKENILQLTDQKKTSLIKEFLENIPKQEKGKFFEWYLAELYKGNGWLTKIQGGRGDSGADILLYHPKTPNQVSLIIQAKNHAAPLTFDQTKIELIKFEQQAAVKYQCQQFNLVAVNGFVKEAQKLSEFNMLLSDWNYIANLIEDFAPDKIEPEIELFSHNKNAYAQVRALWQDNKYVAVVQATGTGKSFIIAQVMADFFGKRQLLLAPSNYILEQQQTKVPWATQSTQFMTYAKCAIFNHNKINNLKLIVLDEFHRCGAEVWGAGVQKILNDNPDAYVLGTTATPVRYLDGSRDMSDELFAGVIAIDLSLADAIIKRILPAPTYIAALYTLAEEINDLLDILKNSNKSDEEKQAITFEINQAKLDWEQTYGIPEILKKHLSSDINKIIVFCKDKDHLDEMEVEVQRWFQRAKIYKWRKVYRVLSGASENDENLATFREAQAKNTVHLLFAIDMLNEGLHIADVGAVIFLRPTESPIIFYQQIGRCLQVDVEHTPIIFDFVNNFKSIRTSDFLERLQDAKEREQEKRAKLGLDENAPVVRIVDETQEIIEIFESVKERLQPWEVMFQQLVEFKNVHGHCNVPNRYPENPPLGNWVQQQRYKNRKGILNEQYIKKLNEIGFVWNPYEVYWENMYAMLVDFVNEYGHCKVPFKWHENLQLSEWFFEQRKLKKKGELSQARIEKLEKLGFDWNPLETDWNEMYQKLIEYKNIYGNCNVPARWSKEPKLGRWVSGQRKTRKIGKLSEERIEKLNKIGFIWNPSQTFENIWEEMFETLIKYKNVYGHYNVPQKWTENPKLGHWVSRQRAAKKEGQLEQRRIDKLNSIGFVWDVKNASWEEMFAQLVEYKTVCGHCNIPNKYPQNPDLGVWVAIQRTSKKNGTLSKEYIERLEKIGFVWKVLETSWEEMFLALVEYKNKYGHCNIPQSYSDLPKLYTWVSHQRTAKQKGTIIEERKKRLEGIGFVWNTLEASWEKMFTELMEYKSTHGHCNVPRRYKPLSTWVNNQRQNKKKGILSQEYIARLNEIGFMWNPNDEFWETMFKSLVEYKEIYGNCNVPAQWNENEQLGNWVSHQRTAKKRDELPAKYIEKLNALGFVWEPSKTYWEKMFETLLEYKNIHGHCKVPDKYSKIPRLNSWVVTQRKLKKQNKLKPEYIERLNKIGFVWNPYEEFWEQMFTMLIKYKDKHGHCKVPNRYSENPQLGQWVQYQRQAKKKDELSKERIERLNNLEFL